MLLENSQNSIIRGLRLNLIVHDIAEILVNGCTFSLAFFLTKALVEMNL